MDSAAAAFALDKPALGPGPPPPSALGPGDCAQARKNFSVSHLLDLEEVAAAGRLAARPAGAEAREPSGGSSGSEAAPQDGECGAWERNGGPGSRGRRLGARGARGARARPAGMRPGRSGGGSGTGRRGRRRDRTSLPGCPAAAWRCLWGWSGPR